jgi:membrane-associated phospholipid phosphatase
MQMRQKRIGTLLLLCLIPAGAISATPPLVKETMDDGVYVFTSPLRLEKQDLPMVLTVSAMLGGSFALDNITRHNLAFYQNTNPASLLRHYGDYAQFGGLMISGVYAVSGFSTHDDHEKRISWDLIESFLWANAVTGTFKIALGRRRPSATDDPFELRPIDVNSSFPSGHTTSAFAAATTLSEYYPTWKVEVPAYAAASAVGFSRMYANQHWGSDVVAGALVGYSVSHYLFKRHQKDNKTSWEIHIETDGIVLSRNF